MNNKRRSRWLRLPSKSHRERSRSHARRRLRLFELLEDRRLLTTWAVQSLADTVANDHVITLREAVMAATLDETVGDAPAGSLHDVITFARCVVCPPQSIVQSVNLDSALGPLEVNAGSNGSISIIGSSPNGSSEWLPIDGHNATSIFSVAGTVNISGIEITNSNTAAIVTGEDSNLTIENSLLTNNRGGAVLHQQGSLTIKNSVLRNNETTGSGGAVWINTNAANPATAAILDTTITANQADGFGGGIANHGGRLSVLRSVISNNFTLERGGGVATLSGGRTSIYESTLEGNEAVKSGGAVYGRESELTVGESVLTNNIAGLGGGGISSANGTSLVVRNTTVSNNTGDDGAGVNSVNGMLEVTGSTLSGNVARGSGGGIASRGTNPNATIVNSTISGNRAFQDGGGVWQEAGSLLLTNVTVALNRSDADGNSIGRGGGLAISNGPSARLVNTLVAGNVSGQSGIETIDDGDTGFAIESGVWPVSDGSGFAGDSVSKVAGQGSGIVSWTFDGLESGRYRVLATWVESAVAATNVPFTLFDNQRRLKTAELNQQRAPRADAVDGGTIFQELGIISVSSGKLVVRLSDHADGDVIADAVRIERVDDGSRLSDLHTLAGSSINTAESYHNLIGDPASSGGLVNDPEQIGNANLVGTVDEFERPVPWNIDRILFTELADNLGGLTAVHALKVDSPAIDAGTFFRPTGSDEPIFDALTDRAGRLISDQRGYPFQRADARSIASLTGPANGALEQSTMPLFHWQPVRTASSYRILVSTDQSALPTELNDPVSSSSLRIDAISSEAQFAVNAGTLAADTTYYWQYRVEDSSTGEVSGWSSPRRFMTGSAALPPDPPRVIRDADEEQSFPVDIGAYEVQHRPLFTAEEIVVSTLTDESDGDFSSGNLSLREAIDIANLRSDHNSIRFAPSLLNASGDPQNVITLSSPLKILWDLTISGPQFRSPTIAGFTEGTQQSTTRLFEIGPMATVEMTGLALRSGGGGRDGVKDFDVFTVNVGGGGALFNAGNAALRDVLFSGNTGNGDGGAVFNSGTMTIRDASFTDNQAAVRINEEIGNGGAIYNAHGKMEIGPDVTFSGGLAIDGGAIYTSGEMTIVDSRFFSALASGDGGAIYLAGSDSSLEIRRSLIRRNHAGNFGGGIASHGSLSLFDTTLEENTAGLYVPFSTFAIGLPLPANAGGGGLFASATNGASILIERTTIRDNVAEGTNAYGGGIYLQPGTENQDTTGADKILIISSTISGNGANGPTVTRGGGVYVDTLWHGAAPVIADSTIAFNHAKDTSVVFNAADSSGGGLFVDGLTQLSNNIISNNDATRRFFVTIQSADDLFIGRGPALVDRVNVIPTIQGGSLSGTTTPLNIDDDPHLQPLDLENGGYTATHKMTAANSSAVDAGERLGLLDQRGFPVTDNTPNLDRPIGDIGAYESSELVFREPFSTQIRSASQYGSGPAFVVGVGFDDGKPESSIPKEPGFLGLEFNPDPFRIGPGIDEDPIFGSEWGAEVTADIDGRIGIEYGYYINSGSVDTFYDGLFQYSLDYSDDNSNLVTLSTAATFTDGQLFTVSPRVSAYADLVFELNASLSGEACAAWCTGVDIPFNFDASTQLFSLNRQLVDENGNALFGPNGEILLDGDIQIGSEPIQKLAGIASDLIVPKVVGKVSGERELRRGDEIALKSGKDEDGNELSDADRESRQQSVKDSVEREKKLTNKVKGYLDGCVGDVVTVCVGQAEDLLGAEVELGIGFEKGRFGAHQTLGSVAVTLPDIQLSDTSFDTDQGKLSATTDDFAFGSDEDAKRRIAKLQVDAAALLGLRFGLPLGTYSATLGPVEVEATTVSYNVGPQFSISQDVEVQPFFDTNHQATFMFSGFTGDIDVTVGQVTESKMAGETVSFLPDEQIIIDTRGKNVDIEPTLKVGNRFSNRMGLDFDVTGLLKVLEIELKFLGEQIFHAGPLFEDEHSLLEVLGIGSQELYTIIDETFDLQGQNDQPAVLSTIQIRPRQTSKHDGKTPGTAISLNSGVLLDNFSPPADGSIVYFSVPLIDENGAVGTDVLFSTPDKITRATKFVRPPYGGMTFEVLEFDRVITGVELGVAGYQFEGLDFLASDSWRLKGFENLLGGRAVFGVQFGNFSSLDILATVEGAETLSAKTASPQLMTAESQRASELQTNAFVIDNDWAFDIDNNRVISATTDGVLVARYLEGKTGDELISGAIADNSQRRVTDENISQAQEIYEYLEKLRLTGRLDVDGSATDRPRTDGVDPSVDGKLILRHMAGIGVSSTSGDALTDGLVIPDSAKRRMPEEIAAFMDGRRVPDISNSSPVDILGRSYRSQSGADEALRVTDDAVRGSSPWAPVVAQFNGGQGIYSLDTFGKVTQFEELYLTRVDGSTRDLLRSNAIGTPGRVSDLLSTLPKEDRDSLIALVRGPLSSELDELSTRVELEIFARTLGVDEPVFITLPFQLGEDVNPESSTRVPDVGGYKVSLVGHSITQLIIDGAVRGNAFFDRSQANDGTDVDFDLVIPGNPTQTFPITMGIPFDLPENTSEFELFPYDLTDPTLFQSNNRSQPDLDIVVGLVVAGPTDPAPEVEVDVYADKNRTPSTLTTVLSPPPRPAQVVMIPSTDASVGVNGTFSIDVEYHVTDTSNTIPSAAVIEIHYDSSRVRFDGLVNNELVTGGLVNSETGIGPENLEVVSDGDLATDRVIVLSWVDTDLLGSWTQHDSSAVVRLATINFQAQSMVGPTSLRVTGESSAGYEFKSASLEIDIPPTLGIVQDVAATNAGFSVTFNAAPDVSKLNLYDSQAGALGPADVTVVGENTGPVRGSLVFSQDNRQVTFIRTGGPLEPDTYQVVLRGADNGFQSASGVLQGGDVQRTFTVDPRPANEVTVSVPDFTRGYGQTVNLPNNSSSGIPVTISTGQSVNKVAFDLKYDPALLTPNGFTTTIPGAMATFTVQSLGLVRVGVSSATEFSSSDGPLELGRLTATVPNTAPYGAKHILQLTNLSVETTGSLPRPARADDGIHIAAFVADNNGSQGYSGGDAVLLQRQIVGLGTGLTTYPLVDPTLLVDVNLGGTVTGGDTTLLQRVIVGIPVTQVPGLPSGVPAPVAAGPDPKLFIPQNISALPGETVTVPVMVEVTEANGITLASVDLAIAFDATKFTASNFRLGSLNGDAGFSNPVVNSSPGSLRVTTSSATGTANLPHGTMGSVFLFDLTVNATAASGTNRLNLLANLSPTTTALSNNDLDELVLIPAPTNADNDSVDGLLTITGTVPTTTLSIAATDASKNEGDSGSTSFTFTVTRAGDDLSGTSTVNYAVTGSGSNPANAADFVGNVLSSGSVSFTANETSKVITIPVNGDTTVESNEGFTVTLSSPVGGTITTSTAPGTINNDDSLPAVPTVILSVNNANIAEAGGVATVTATLSATTTVPVTVQLGFSGTVTLTSDYTRSGTQIVISAGQTTGTTTITAVQDTLVEGNETVIVDITSVTNGTESGVQQVTTTIIDDDSAPIVPSVTLSVNNANIAEAGGVATVTATLSATTTVPVSVQLGFSGTATLTSDYMHSGTQIVIPAGQMTSTITVTAVQDTLVEGNETVIVDITGVTNGTEAGTQQATTTITDETGLIPLPTGETRVTNESGTIFVRNDNNVLFQDTRENVSDLTFQGGDGSETLAVGELGLIDGQRINLRFDGQGDFDTFRLLGESQTIDLTTLGDEALQNMESIDITGSGANSLTLNVTEVLNISPATGTLRVQHDEGDTVNYGAGWSLRTPQVVDGQFLHVLTQANATIHVINDIPWQNPLRALDVNRDGSVSPLDAQIGINSLNTHGPGILVIPASIGTSDEFFYFDSSGDGKISPLDVLLVVNFLNDPVQNPEGEAAPNSFPGTVLDEPGMFAIRDSAALVEHPERMRSALDDVFANIQDTRTSTDPRRCSTHANRIDSAAEELFRALELGFCELDDFQ